MEISRVEISPSLTAQNISKNDIFTKINANKVFKRNPRLPRVTLPPSYYEKLFSIINTMVCVPGTFL